MTTFDERMKAYENKYVHDKLLEFKSIARRNRLLGEWVAEKLHLAPTEKHDYAMSVVRSDLDAPGDLDIVTKILSDLKNAGIKMSVEQLKAQMQDFYIEAKQMVEREH